jgi:His/Glu/Gln/Arg/opine family amino acid ABC transporter permease subunit
MGSAMASVFRLLADYGPAFVQALLLTWKLTAISFAAGFVLGLVVTVLRLLPLRPLRFVLTGYVEIFRNIPSAVLLIFIVFALPDLNVLIDYEPSVILTLTLVCSAFTADYLRAGINTVSGGQVQAALSLGMRPIRSSSRSVVLPQALARGGAADDLAAHRADVVDLAGFAGSVSGPGTHRARSQDRQ